ncbi:MAG: ABC transporter permease, partial [Gorillibacterium sp.]|nr:ABC transporter permease [Gorillibacterium sp.]
LSLVSVPFLGGATNQDAVSISVEFSPLIVAGSFVLGIIMVLASISAPARAAARISEIDAIRYNPVKIGRNKKTRARLNALPRTRISIASLIRANFSRNRKRTLLTILSITLTGLVFLIVSNVLNSMDIKNMTSMMIQGDYQLRSTETPRNVQPGVALSDPLSVDSISEIRQINGIKEIFTEKYENLIYNPEDAAKHITFNEQQMEHRNSYISLNIYGYNDALLDVALHALQAGRVTREEMINNNYVIAINDEQNKYSPGDKIRVTTWDKREFMLTIAGVVSQYITYKGSDSDGGTFIAHENLFTRLALDQRVKQLSVTVEKEQFAKVEQALRQMATSSDSKLTFASFKETFDEFNGMKRTMEIAAYAFIAVLMFISIFNLINTILTSILSRNREISMLEAIGQTRGQLLLQLAGEGLLQVMISLIIVYAVGLPAGYAIVTTFQKEATYAIYRLPILPILVLAVSYVCTVILVTFAIQSKLHQQSLIQRMKGVE